MVFIFLEHCKNVVLKCMEIKEFLIKLMAIIATTIGFMVQR